MTLTSESIFALVFHLTPKLMCAVFKIVGKQFNFKDDKPFKDNIYNFVPRIKQETQI